MPTLLSKDGEQDLFKSINFRLFVCYQLIREVPGSGSLGFDQQLKQFGLTHFLRMVLAYLHSR